MSDPGDTSSVSDAQLRVMQIVAAALVMGSVMAMGIFLFIRNQPNAPPPQDIPVMLYVGAALSVGALVARLFLPDLIIAGQLSKRFTLPEREQPEPQMIDRYVAPWPALYQMRLIICGALMEGVAFFWLITYFLTGELVSLGAALVFILILIVQIPTRGRVESWIETQQVRRSQG
jgi:hypothetical protein